MALWSVTATLYFPDGSSTWEKEGDHGLEIAQVLTRLEESLDADPSLGGRPLRVRFTGTDADRPHERPGSLLHYPWAVDAFLSVEVLDR